MQRRPMLNRPLRQRGVLAWFASNHVAANLLMVVVLVAGGLTLWHIKVEVFQEIDPAVIRVQVPYPGASPSEVEEGICVRVEEAIKGIDGIKRISSAAGEDMGTVVAELEDYAVDREVLDDIKAAVDRIEDFPPKDAEEPVVVDVDSNIQVVSVVIYGDAPDRTLKALAEQVRDELTAMNNISLVDVAGARRYEISIEVSEHTLRRYGLTLEQVAEAVRHSSLDLPGGAIKTEGGIVLIRTKGQRYTGPDFEDVVVRTRTDGTKLHLRDLATIVDGFEDTDLYTFFDGKPAVLLKVYRVGDQGALDVADTVQLFVDTYTVPARVQMTTWFNRATYLKGRMHLLVRNAMIGLVLVFLCLTMLLDLRLAFWTTMGIPISFMGGFVLMPMFGVSVNMISLFALIVVLGIVVDDAIVVGENVFAYRQQGMDPLQAAIKGVREMAMPVVLAVLTTIAAFAPLAYTAGQLGKILWPMPVVVTSVLAVSLIEALLILPAHLTSAPMLDRPGAVGRGQLHVRNALQWFIEQPYAWALAVAARWRYVTVCVALAVLAATIGFVGGGHIQIGFLPHMDADNVWASLKMPQGTPVQQTQAVVKRLETALRRVQSDLDQQMPEGSGSIVRHVATSVGEQPFTSLMGGGPGAVASAAASVSHLAEVNVELLSGEERPFSSRFVGQRWRQALGDVPGISSLTFTSQFFTAGEAINVELTHHDFEQLLLASDRLKRELAGFRGVSDITDSFEPGKRELELSLRPAGQAAGLTLEDLARQVRQSFYGEEVQRVQRGRDDVKVMVRYPEHERRSLADVDDMRFRLPDATEVPFGTVAAVRESRGYASIDRVNRRRVVKVTADVDETVANATEINNALRRNVLPSLKRQWSGLSYSFQGEQREQAESLASMGQNMLIALLVIFALLAVQFRSYVQPLIVMCVIPFGLVGAVLGHVIMGLNLSMLSGFGVVALTGVVVNDSLIMIDLINRRRDGTPMRQAILESGMRRFRPILLTTLTTFCGLMPMILERSLQAQFLIPMAVSLGFGVLFATAITLLLVPTVYLILEDVVQLFEKTAIPTTAAPAGACLALLATLATVPGCHSRTHTASTRTAAAAQERLLMTNARQLTFEGRRSGEGYFSADGRHMVFQSEREPGNPFFQIYLMDMWSGRSKRLSPGIGKTTCAWIHPDGQMALFASTHQDPQATQKQEDELKRRAAGTKRRYQWDYDKHFEIYQWNRQGGALTKLTSAPGYDAEGSYSPDGRLIAFASNRHAYDTDLPAIDRQRFEQDMSYLMDIYLMNADGSDARRLTTAPGYDGGPFFSPDGARICWRRFDEDGARAEVFTMNLDGSDVRQITRLGAMSWAPYYHPSGDYLIFTTNLNGFANFELYLVDTDGRRQPVRITFTDGFDGLPVYTPDGAHLVWTTKRGAERRSQLFIADWNDAYARKLLRLPQRHGSESSPRLAQARQSGTAPFTQRALMMHVRRLASDEMEGRLTGTPGERLATDYVAGLFSQIGLEPAGDDGSYFQSFSFTAGVSLGLQNQLTWETDAHRPTPYRIDHDWRPLAFSKTGHTGAGPVVFAGYGISAPPSPQGGLADGYESYAHLDVSDKWVLVFRFMPAGIPAEKRQALGRFSGLRYKAMVARDRGARGLIVVSGPTAKVKHELVPLRFDASLGGTSIAVLSVSNDVANDWFKSAGHDLDHWQQKLDKGDQAMGFRLAGVTLSAAIDIQQETKTGRNVLARLGVGDQTDDGDEPAGGTIVIGAHVDHLGRGAGPNSLATGGEHGDIHYGADDNASGVAALIEIARHMSRKQRSGQLAVRRDLLFAAWSGEEIGLLGSNHFVRTVHPDAEDEPIYPAIAAYLNMDMIGRYANALTVHSVGSSTAWPALIERANVPVGLRIVADNDSYVPSDSTSFYVKGAPILSAFTGAHSDYHTPGDTADKINATGIQRTAWFVARVAEDLAGAEAMPDYLATPRPGAGAARAHLRAYLGTIPDYSQTGIVGLKLAGVGHDGPAQKAGIQGGDVVVELAGRKIENIYDYTYAIEALKIAESVSIVVVRDGRKLRLSITPDSRE